MVTPNRRLARNKTISAIAVLGAITIPNPEFEQEYESRVILRKSDGTGNLPVEESLGIRIDLYRELRPTLGEALKLRVFDNPLARKPLPTYVLDGEYDARYRFNDSLGKIERVFAGRGLQEAERVTEAEFDLSSKIDRFAQAIVERFAPKRIVRFGSYAYGCPESGSDVDLLVILAGDGNAADRSLDILKSLNPDFPLDLLTRSAGEVERRMMMGDPFIREILDKGKTLYPRKGVA
ncbi:MAG: nucleotidyltransferase domain-containing protein [Planctomycetes bacterium]|nr:nucleotidyltransferase domain-containing protein [Planctomycetota bacterium]